MSVRRVVRITLKSFAGLLVAVMAMVLILLGTKPGHDFLARRLLSLVNDAVDGTVHLGSLRGALWKSVEVNALQMNTRDGQQVIGAERITVSYRLVDLLRGRLIFRNVRLVHPVIELNQQADGRWNIEQLFKISAKDTSVHAKRPLVELRDAEILNGTLIIRARGAQDTVITHAITGLTTDLARLRVSHPDSTPLVAEIRRLAAKIDNPDLDLRQADGTITLNGDSLRFDVDHVTLPGTRATLSGQMHWGGPHLQLDAALNASPIAFADVRGIIPDLPQDGGGDVAVRARLGQDGTISADIRSADVRSGRSVIRGRGAFTVHPDRTGTAHGVDLELAPLDFALLKPYAPTLPVKGTVRGRIVGEGTLTDLVVDTKLAWTDENVPAHPVNTLDAQGRMVFGGHPGLDFRAFNLRSADMDMASIRSFAPSVKLAGRLHAAGILEGPWHEAQFNGVLDHYASDPAQASTLHGALKLGIGDTARVDAELQVDSLSMNLLRRTYPQIPVTGMLRGRASVHGLLDSLGVDLVLRGSAGSVTARGMVGVRDSAVVLALAGTFDSLDLHGMRETQPPSELAGSWRANIVAPTDSTRVAVGNAELDVSGVQLGQVALGPGTVGVRLEPERIAIDSAKLAFTGGGLEATGAIGRGPGSQGEINLAMHADTVGYLEPLLRFFATAPGDSSVVKLEGGGTLNANVTGNMRTWRLTSDAAVDGITLKTDFARALKLHAEITSDTGAMVLEVRASADTAKLGTMGYQPIVVAASGRLDSLVATANVGFMRSSALRTRVTTWRPDSLSRIVRVEELDLDLPVHAWRLAQPVTAHIGNRTISIDSFDFRPTEGLGYLAAAGTFSRGGESSFLLNADSVPLEDVWAVLQRDTSGVKGAMSVDARVAGEAESPAIELALELANGRMEDYVLPLLQVEGQYRNRQLTINGGLSDQGQRLITVHGTLPLDLALTPVANRQVAGNLDLSANADSLDMRVFNAVTSSISGVAGRMAMNVHAGGSWTAPRFSGFVDISNASVRVPSAGINYNQIELRFESPGDSIWHVRRGQISSGSGTLNLTGGIGFRNGRLGVRMGLQATQFAAFDIPTLGNLTISGRDTLYGPLIGATLEGRNFVDAGTLRFANLVQKRIVSLDDPEFRAMVDSNLAGADLAPAAHQIFFDSLRIANLTLDMGSDVWLRSTEANIQLAGQIQVQRHFADNLPRYRIDGTLRAVRGNYKLAIGVENSPVQVTRDFRVTRGTVRFFGTPDLNPEMDVVAEYQTRSIQREPLTVRAVIEGTLLYPRLRLETDSPLPLTETEIASYLMFGTPQPNLGGLGVALQGAGSVLGSVGQAAANEIGIPLNYLTVTPGASQPTTTQGNGSQIANARIEAGVQVNRRTFLTLNAGLCEVGSTRNGIINGVGINLEYRLSDAWSLVGSREPVVQTCGASAIAAQLRTGSQFGFDLFWQTGIR